MGIYLSNPLPSDVVYNSTTWNGNLDAPTKNAIRDEIELLLTSLAGKIDSDSDLNTIAALTPTNDDIMQYKSGAWANRTLAQIKADLALVPSSSNFGLLTYFGDGSDGDLNINSGTTTLTRDTYYNNVTITGTGSINNAGWKIFVKGTLDLSNAPAGAITRTSNSGGNASGGTAGSAGSQLGAITVGTGIAGGAGGTGTTGAASNGTGASSTTTAAGGQGGAGGSGGAPALAAGGTGGAAGTVGTLSFRRFILDFIRGATLVSGGMGGSGGGSGTGDGSNVAGGGGGGGGGGNLLVIYAKTINRDATNTAIGALRCLGRPGGNGGNSAGGNSGGGGGGSGSGGGFVYIAYETLTGSAKTGLIDVSGGTGGNGGNGAGTGRGGQGGQGGAGGRVTLINLTTGVVTETDATTTLGSTPSTPGTTAGGSGTSGTTTQVTL